MKKFFEELEENGLALRCLHNAIGDELFFSFLEEYQDQISTIELQVFFDSLIL